MNNLKRVAIFLAVAALLIVVGVSYKGNDILKRAIVLGIGVDATETGEVSVTAEIVSPGNGGEQVGMFSKIVSATGKTVAEALQNISVKSGKETSLGQCVLLMYGEDFTKSDFTSTAEYFVRSDSFKESAAVCCCEGKAQDMFNKGDAISQSVSLGLSAKLNGLSKDVAIPSCNVLVFSRGQTELYRTGYLNYVTFQDSENTSTVNPDQPQGFFVCNRVAVFRNYKLVGVLSERETKGFAVLAEKISGNTFAVKGDNETLLTLRASRKKVDAKQQKGEVSFAVEMRMRLARTDSFGADGNFAAKTDEKIPQALLDQAKEQSLELAQLFLQKQVEWDVDLLNIHEMFRQQQGNTEEVKTLQMKDIPVKLSVEVKGK